MLSDLKLNTPDFEIKGVPYRIICTEQKGRRVIHTVKRLDTGTIKEMEHEILKTYLR
jgi:hypothetical protein